MANSVEFKSIFYIEQLWSNVVQQRLARVWTDVHMRVGADMLTLDYCNIQPSFVNPIGREWLQILSSKSRKKKNKQIFEYISRFKPTTSYMMAIMLPYWVEKPLSKDVKCKFYPLKVEKIKEQANLKSYLDSTS